MSVLVEVAFILCLFVDFVFVAQDEGLGQLEIVSDLLPADCFALEIDYQLVDKTYKLPKCTSNWAGACDKYYKTVYRETVYKPTCTKDGTFAAVQCKGDRASGRCFCFDEKANRIFGQQWWTEAANMTCACSRRKAEMSDPTSDSYIFYNSLHCNSIGNYESLQCDMVSEQCWCAHEQTGELTSTVVPYVAKAKLPCYNSLDVGSQYLRQCENKKYAQTNIEYRLSLRGSSATFGTYLCDGDGSFGAFTITDGLGYCTWRDNTHLGSWSSGDPDPAILNCNCARDTRIYSDAGKTQLLKCGPTGNYQSYQASGTNKYCVDVDGYRKSGTNVTANEDADCAQYVSYSEKH